MSANRSRTAAWAAAAFALVVGAFLLDVTSGNEVSASLFYVVGIAAGAWFVDRRLGLLLAGLSTIAWALAVRLAGPGFSTPTVFYWNLAVELAIYVTLAIAIDRVHRGLRNERLLVERVTAARDELDREARAVGDLQREMLPAQPPSMPGYEWQLHYSTSTHAGGDYYDFFDLRDGRLGVFLGDASGHGPQAAILMAMMRGLLHTTPDPLCPPDQVLARLGQQIARTVPEGRFATACYALLDPASGRLEFSLAGHPPPLLLRVRGDVLEELPMRGGPPLGRFGESAFEAGVEALLPGDTLVLFTDGLTEAMGPNRELFGDDQLRQALRGAGSLPLAGLRDRVLARLAAHTAGAPLEDDLTLLMLRLTPAA